MYNKVMYGDTEIDESYEVWYGLGEPQENEPDEGEYDKRAEHRKPGTKSRRTRVSRFPAYRTDRKGK